MVLPDKLIHYMFKIPQNSLLIYVISSRNLLLRRQGPSLLRISGKSNCRHRNKKRPLQKPKCRPVNSNIKCRYSSCKKRLGLYLCLFHIFVLELIKILNEKARSYITLFELGFYSFFFFTENIDQCKPRKGSMKFIFSGTWVSSLYFIAYPFLLQYYSNTHRERTQIWYISNHRHPQPVIMIPQ